MQKHIFLSILNICPAVIIIISDVDDWVRESSILMYNYVGLYLYCNVRYFVNHRAIDRRRCWLMMLFLLSMILSQGHTDLIRRMVNWSCLGKCPSQKIEWNYKSRFHQISLACQYFNFGQVKVITYTEREYNIRLYNEVTWWASFFYMMIRNQNLFLVKYMFDNISHAVISQSSGILYLLPNTVSQNILYKCLLGKNWQIYMKTIWTLYSYPAYWIIVYISS